MYIYINIINAASASTLRDTEVLRQKVKPKRTTFLLTVSQFNTLLFFNAVIDD